jgi:hypothetical protein
MKNPLCDRDDCKLQEQHSCTTLAYYQPVYNSEGVNTNPDRNRISCTVNCSTCGRSFVKTNQYPNETWNEKFNN